MEEQPVHYKEMELEPFDVMNSCMSIAEREGFYRGNVLKYIMRYPSKGKLDDLVKARVYIDKLIELYEKNKEAM